MYPRNFAASAIDPSTAQMRSNKACIPCGKERPQPLHGISKPFDAANLETNRN